MKNLDAKRCPICRALLKKERVDFKASALVTYKCALFGNAHYAFKFGNDFIAGDEEMIIIRFNHKKYEITQYLSNNDVLVVVYDNEDQYICTSEFNDLPTLAFDFLDGDMNKIVNKLKVMLTFQ